MSDYVIFEDIFQSAGVTEYGVVDPKDVEFTEEVRKYCEDNKCRKYGTTWACPPAVGTVDECRARAQSFSRMIVFSVKYDISDSFDFEGMKRGMMAFKSVADSVDDGMKALPGSCLILGNEGCGKCGECTYPDAPCRFPDKVHGSIEGYGIFVNKLAAQAGIRYNNGPDTITYFGAVLYGETDKEDG
ncbi:MAG: DUF2284 domain-containing protein [Peptococcaceae bacterium]|jgi:predicted metal-binding protein|nr:DUF2284 domain-containing protein [Peptococcaceae bacterium]